MSCRRLGCRRTREVPTEFTEESRANTEKAEAAWLAQAQDDLRPGGVGMTELRQTPVGFPWIGAEQGRAGGALDLRNLSHGAGMISKIMPEQAAEDCQDRRRQVLPSQGERRIEEGDLGRRQWQGDAIQPRLY